MRIKQFLLFLLLSLISLFFFLSCANRKSPTGGEKDTKGPQTVKTIPGNKSVNYHGSEIYFEFDEHIKEDNLLQKILISPAIDSTFTFKIVKKKLFITFHKKLKDSTTYTINLGEAIKDITEGNPARDSKLIFSTGSVLDSLDISGKLTELETGKPAKDVLVGLYSASDTITPFNGKPIYISRTNENGLYLLENLASRNYLIYAINDINRDLRYSNQNELIGFKSDTIFLKEKIEKLPLTIEKFDLRNLRVNRSSTQKEISVIELNKGLSSIELKYPSDSIKTVYYTTSKEQNKINIYNTLKIYDSIPLQLVAVDSFNTKIDTTFKISFQKEEEKKNARKEKIQKKNVFELNIQPSNTILSTSDIEITSELPIVKYGISNIYFFRDSLTKYPLKEEDLLWNPSHTKFSVKKNIPFPDTINFQIDSASFVNVRTDSNSMVKVKYTKKQSDEYSSIGGSVEIKATDFIIQLIKKEGNKIFEIKNKRIFKFDFLEPGTYSLRVLVDENKNGKWDRGDLKKRIEPEKIIHYNITDSKGKTGNEIVLKANWELLENVITESE